MSRLPPAGDAIANFGARHSGALPSHPRAVLVVGSRSAATSMVLDALSCECPERAPIVVPRRADAEHYLHASADAGRSPAAAILTIDATADAEEQVSLLRWIRRQHEGLRSTPVILLGRGPTPDLGNDLFSCFLQHADLGAITHALSHALGHGRWIGALDPPS